jgi:hypothetical protein
VAAVVVVAMGTARSEPWASDTEGPGAVAVVAVVVAMVVAVATARGCSTFFQSASRA